MLTTRVLTEQQSIIRRYFIDFFESERNEGKYQERIQKMMAVGGVRLLMDMGDLLDYVPPTSTADEMLGWNDDGVGGGGGVGFSPIEEALLLLAEDAEGAGADGNRGGGPSSAATASHHANMLSLGLRLLYRPGRYIPLLELAVHDLLLRLQPEYLKVDYRSRVVHVGFDGPVGQIRSPRELYARHLNTMVVVEGIITRQSTNRPRVIETVHYCPATNRFSRKEFRDQLSPMMDSSHLPTVNVMPKTDMEGNPLRTELGLSVFRDSQCAILQEAPEKSPTGQLPRHVELRFDDDLVDRVKPGDRVVAVGVYMPFTTSESKTSVQSILLVNHIVNTSSGSLDGGGKDRSHLSKGEGDSEEEEEEEDPSPAAAAAAADHYEFSSSTTVGGDDAGGGVGRRGGWSGDEEEDPLLPPPQEEDVDGAGEGHSILKSTRGGRGGRDEDEGESSSSSRSNNNNNKTRRRRRRGNGASLVRLRPVTALEERLMGFAKKMTALEGPTGVLRALSRSIAPTIYGLSVEKKAILLLLVGGVERRAHHSHIRGDINILLVGEPSTAKSQLLRFVLFLSPLALSTTGKGSSGVGLTAAVTVDPYTGERSLSAGAMVLADRGILCVDEFDKMSPQDRVAMHEAMEQQTVTIAKAGIHASLNARCSVLAAANPIYGFYSVQHRLSFNVGLPESLLSRFDLMFIILDQHSSEYNRRIGTYILRNHMLSQPVGLDASHQRIQTVVQQQPATAGESGGGGGGGGGGGAGGDERAGEEDRDGGRHSSSASQPTSTSSSSSLGLPDAFSPTTNSNGERIASVAFLQAYIQFAKQGVPRLTEKSQQLVSTYYVQLRAEQQQQQESGEKDGFFVTARTLEAIIRLSTAHAKLRLSPVVEEEDVKLAMELLRASVCAASTASALRAEDNQPQALEPVRPLPEGREGMPKTMTTAAAPLGISHPNTNAPSTTSSRRTRDGRDEGMGEEGSRNEYASSSSSADAFPSDPSDGSVTVRNRNHGKRVQFPQEELGGGGESLSGSGVGHYRRTSSDDKTMSRSDTAGDEDQNENNRKKRRIEKAMGEEEVWREHTSHTSLSSPSHVVPSIIPSSVLLSVLRSLQREQRPAVNLTEIRRRLVQTGLFFQPRWHASSSSSSNNNNSGENVGKEDNPGMSASDPFLSHHEEVGKEDGEGREVLSLASIRAALKVMQGDVFVFESAEEGGDDVVQFI